MHGHIISSWKAKARPADPANFTGAVLQHNITGTSTEVQLLGVYFPAGARTIIHTHPTDQLLQCIDGEIAVGIGKQRLLLRPGEMVIIPKGVWHWHGATPLGDAAHYSIKPHAETNWGGAPAEEQAEFDAYDDWATWVAGVQR